MTDKQKAIDALKDRAYRAAVEAAYAGRRYFLDLEDSVKMVEDGYYEKYGAEAFGGENLTRKYLDIWQEQSKIAIELHEKLQEMMGEE